MTGRQPRLPSKQPRGGCFSTTVTIDHQQPFPGRALTEGARGDGGCGPPDLQSRMHRGAPSPRSKTTSATLRESPPVFGNVVSGLGGDRDDSPLSSRRRATPPGTARARVGGGEDVRRRKSAKSWCRSSRTRITCLPLDGYDFEPNSAGDVEVSCFKHNPSSAAVIRPSKNRAGPKLAPLLPPAPAPWLSRSKVVAAAPTAARVFLAGLLRAAVATPAPPPAALPYRPGRRSAPLRGPYRGRNKDARSARAVPRRGSAMVGPRRRARRGLRRASTTWAARVEQSGRNRRLDDCASSDMLRLAWRTTTSRSRCRPYSRAFARRASAASCNTTPRNGSTPARRRRHELSSRARRRTAAIAPRPRRHGPLATGCAAAVMASRSTSTAGVTKFPPRALGDRRFDLASLRSRTSVAPSTNDNRQTSRSESISFREAPRSAARHRRSRRRLAVRCANLRPASTPRRQTTS